MLIGDNNASVKSPFKSVLKLHCFRKKKKKIKITQTRLNLSLTPFFEKSFTEISVRS